jgi:HSP20 family protein
LISLGTSCELPALHQIQTNVTAAWQSVETIAHQETNMAILKWAPFSAFTELEQQMHSLLDRIGARPWSEGFGWKPDTDIFREEGDLVVLAELPGLDPDDDLYLTVEDNVLQIKGEKSESTAVEGDTRYVQERRYGSFQRSVMLPDGVDPTAVQARYDNGVLTVRIPLPEAATEEGGHQKIHVDVATGSGG